MRDAAERGEDLVEPLVVEDERIAARDDDLADARVRAQIGDRLGEVGAGERPLARQREAAAGAVPAVDRAAVGGEEQGAVRVAVDDRPHRPADVLAERIAQIAGRALRLLRCRDRLDADRAGGVGRIDERGVVRRHGHARPPVGEGEAAPLGVRERDVP